MVDLDAMALGMLKRNPEYQGVFSVSRIQRTLSWRFGRAQQACESAVATGVLVRCNQLYKFNREGSHGNKTV